MSEQRRLTLGDQLRLLRESRQLSGKQLAESLGWPASKISRIENAKQSVSDSDLVGLCTRLQVDRQERESLRNELRAIRIEEARWNAQLRVGHRAVQEQVATAERAARHIRGFSLALIPGLLQTAEYARYVFASLADLHGTEPDTEAAVRARMERQGILYESNREIELLLTEYSLRSMIAPGEVMAAQLDRLIAVQHLPALRMGIVPSSARSLAATMHDFVIKDDTVTVELMSTEMTTRDPGDSALYNRVFDKLDNAAVRGEDARTLLLRIGKEYGAARR